MRELVTIELNEDQIKRLTIKHEAVITAKYAFENAAKLIRGTEEELWNDVQDMIDLPENSRPTISWTEKQIIYFK